MGLHPARATERMFDRVVSDPRLRPRFHTRPGRRRADRPPEGRWCRTHLRGHRVGQGVRATRPQGHARVRPSRRRHHGRAPRSPGSLVARAAGDRRATEDARHREEKIDTSSAAGELLFHVFGAIAQFERRLIAERTRDGIRAARAEGRKPGRPGLDRDKLEAVMLLVAGGLSPTKAAKQIGFGRSTVYRELALRSDPATDAGSP